MPEGALLDTLADITAASVSRSDLSPEGLLLVRLAALVAVDAPTESYLLALRVGAETELTLEHAQSVLIAVAPIVGTAKTIAAASKITDALGLALEVLAEEIDLEDSGA